MTKEQAQLLVRMINDLIEYKIRDMTQEGDEEKIGYYFEISATNEELQAVLETVVVR